MYEYRGKNCYLTYIFLFFLRLSENGKPFQARVTMPRLRIASKYLSSGVLIILPASGNGTFSGTFGNKSISNSYLLLEDIFFK